MTAVYERHESSTQISRDNTVTMTQVYRVRLDDPSQRSLWGLAVVGIDKYDAHPDDNRLLALDVTATDVPDELGWVDVTYTYSNPVFDSGVTEMTGGVEGTGPGSQDPIVQPNPTLRTPTVRYSTNKRTVPFTRDFDDPRKLVVNSAGSPYEGLEREITTKLITVSINRAASYNIVSKGDTYEDTVNDDIYSPVPTDGPYLPGTLKCNTITGSFQFEAPFGWYRNVEIEFEYNKRGWEMEQLDAGYFQRVNQGEGVYREEKIMDPTGQPLDAPVKLNGAGERLNPGDTVVVAEPYTVVDNGTVDVSVYKTFYVYEWVNFDNIYS